ncbi:nuclear transport factor 2 family protein [Thalassomonas haliotis]|uniref:Nuclear transport factor 2 family protein n=1 Tax=Thalassomonas haliotis TaxID=485448 RepID=A0ABY7VCX9_9GAMM|nr:nuclear transport factor 2 family protein [Thalassomonas haliotis]WDE11196.1 nuclear transport factor 2 family protein [Thalassomonas haliotis]
MKILCLLVALLSAGFCHANEDVARVLDNFHQAAARADMKTYLGLMTKEAVFLGTDAGERWDKQAFSEFVKPYFSQGKGWLYRPQERHINQSGDNMAFFDELLSNENYGLCRGSGVLVKTETGWKIAQYNLSIPVPNAIAKKVVKQIKTLSQVKGL